MEWGKRMNNKWIRAAIPALLIHISVGTVYCWSTLKETIANEISMSQFSVGWAFSFAIFVLGISAAFAGKFVEKNIHQSSLIACICFSAGMIGTGLVIKFLTGWAALIGIYIFYGLIMGIGLGVGYLTPIKTLMLWFEKNKGLATGISIMGFGLAKAIATPVMDILQKKIGVASMFMILGTVYFVIMFIGHLLLKKPYNWVEAQTKEKTHIWSMFKKREFVGIWLMFYLNIHCGLMIISYEKQILSTVFATTASMVTIVGIVPSFTAISNTLGRIGYSALSDRMKQRNTIYKIIFISCIIISALMIVTNVMSGIAIILLSIIVIAYLLIINAGYGGGFSTLPALLSERFGMEKISQIHGIALSAWAIAGLTGNNTAEIVLNLNGGYNMVIAVATILYAVALVICFSMVRSKKEY